MVASTQTSTVTRRTLSRGRALVIGGALLAIAAGVAFGLNAGGLRDRLLGPRVPPIASLAVVPLENRSDDSQHAYLADAISAFTGMELQRLGAWRVLNYSSVRKDRTAPKPLPEIARELEVDALVEGSVRRAGGQTQITANLVQSAGSRRIWSGTFDRGGDLHALVSEVIREIARATKTPLTLLAMGRMEEAVFEAGRALAVDPSNAGLLACVGWHRIATREYDQAEVLASRALGMGAPDQLARLALGWSYQLRGRHEQAIPEFQKAVVGWNNAVLPTATLAHAYAVAGQAPAAREVLGRLLARAKTGYVSPYEIAVVYAGLGERDRAFEWLEKAYQDGSSFLVYFRMDPRIWSLLQDPRFDRLLQRMNFPRPAQP